ncbi:MAG TPA: cadherin-like domain-containing protein, partial [Verrucomicrobiae bacterium]|nr:cadherin-like domain-containing protein [Verrucomicrobiae bacterium]
NLPATAIGTNTATLNGQILDTGGNSPSITLYYGPTDGGTNAAAWANSITLGFQSGAFAQMLTGLSVNATYYYTFKAVNVVGTTWATPSQSFTTITLPTVANLPATGIQDTFATLNGQILFTGNQTPIVTIYYGPTDGGVNPSAWSNSITLGLQGGVFSQTVNYLSTNTTYFFTAQAANIAGAVLAAPSQTFTTVATNSLPPPMAAVVTQHNDNGRTGMNLNELLLNVGNVNTNSFGLLYTRPVDDQIYAQPLLATNINIPGRGTHNILIVATVNGTIYAFDADVPTLTAPYWTNSFINPPNIVPPNNADMSALGACGGAYQDFSGKFGIVGTPVIDPNAGTIYLVVRTKEFSTNFVQRLHALDITTGLDRSNSPVVISAAVPGTGSGSVGGVVSFNPVLNNQRPALTLANGVVFITWSSHCDNGSYHGWVMGYDAGTLQQVAVFNDTPNGSQGGIWMSGQGPAADDSGNIFLVTGNGSVDAADFGEAFLKLTPATNGAVMTVSSFFIPSNWSTLNASDLDLGTGGLLLIPNTSLAIAGGKSGTLYVVRRDKMGGLGGTNGGVVQSWTPNANSEIHGGPVLWSVAKRSFMYIWPDSGDHLRQYRFTNGLFNITPVAQGAPGGGGSPGGILSGSASGAAPGTGIIWASVNKASDANQAVVTGTLHAYDAQNVANELWNSDQNATRDALGKLAKFVAPTVANGKVYMATFSGQLNVYGLLPQTANFIAETFENQPRSIPTAALLSVASDPYGFPLTITGVSPNSTNGGTVVFGTNTVTYTPVSGYIGADRFTYTVGDGQGGFALASVLIRVLQTNRPSGDLLPISKGPGGVTVSFAGIPGLTYTLQRAPTVAGPWTAIAAISVDESGIGAYVDSSPLPDDAYYRTVYP